ncbi:MAG: dihydroorotase family protein [Candidatus Lokiarchaeota archaeon]|nr:dihydroorotase family protein [Candidatus Lokiarchaeota archaeon]
MILKNAKIYSEGLIHKGALLLNDGIIRKIKFNPKENDFKELVKRNQDNKELDCQNKLILPGIIDIHSHLRDMGQSEKETFLTGTRAAAFSGITTIFSMPNTKPPAILAKQIKKWMEKARNNIFVNVGFISGVPKGFDYDEIIKIIELGVIGFKIYPLNSINEIDWTDTLNIQKLLNISYKFQIPIFIHPDWPLSQRKKTDLYQEFMVERYPFLEFHNRLFPVHMEAKYVNFILENCYKIITNNNLDPENYPIIHFCHISCKESYSLIQKALQMNSKLKITFELTPHHLLLSHEIKLDNPNNGKVLPPLRDKEHSSYLLNELKKGQVNIIATDHAPHTKEDKQEELNALSGFPGFETYPLVILDKVFRYQVSFENFVKAASENPALIFNLKNKGFIKEGYDADLLIVDKVPDYKINSQNFKTKAKFSPFENFITSVQIWKVFLRGTEINNDDSVPNGKVIKRML